MKNVWHERGEEIGKPLSYLLPSNHSFSSDTMPTVFGPTQNKKTAYHSLSMSVYLVLPFSSISFSLFHSLKNRRESETRWRKNRRRRNGKSFSRWGRLNEISLLFHSFHMKSEYKEDETRKVSGEETTQEEWYWNPFLENEEWGNFFVVVFTLFFSCLWLLYFWQEEKKYVTRMLYYAQRIWQEFKVKKEMRDLVE